MNKRLRIVSQVIDYSKKLSLMTRFGSGELSIQLFRIYDCVRDINKSKVVLFDSSVLSCALGISLHESVDHVLKASLGHEWEIKKLSQWLGIAEQNCRNHSLMMVKIHKRLGEISSRDRIENEDMIRFSRAKYEFQKALRETFLPIVEPIVKVLSNLLRLK